MPVCSAFALDLSHHCWVCQRAVQLHFQYTVIQKMTSVNLFASMLMPISQVTAWFAILHDECTYTPFYPSVFYMTLFYCLWASIIRVWQESAKCWDSTVHPQQEVLCQYWEVLVEIFQHVR
jgi:hypothetical protein